MSDLTDKLRGKFIVLDGPDGAGKTTQLQLLTDRLQTEGLTVCLVRDPGGTAIGEQVRQILLNPVSGDIDPACEMLLFMACRAQLVAAIIRPALAAGEVVLCDRFVSSTVAYQGASGVDGDGIINIWKTAGADFWPDLTIVLDLPPETGMQRVSQRNGDAEGDRMEQRPDAYHQRVREIFHTLADSYPAPVRYVQADRGIDAVVADVAAAIEETFEADG